MNVIKSKTNSTNSLEDSAYTLSIGTDPTDLFNYYIYKEDYEKLRKALNAVWTDGAKLKIRLTEWPPRSNSYELPAAMLSMNVVRDSATTEFVSFSTESLSSTKNGNDEKKAENEP